jgi:hypothetical protein
MDGLTMLADAVDAAEMCGLSLVLEVRHTVAALEDVDVDEISGASDAQPKLAVDAGVEGSTLMAQATHVIDNLVPKLVPNTCTPSKLKGLQMN